MIWYSDTESIQEKIENVNILGFKHIHMAIKYKNK